MTRNKHFEDFKKCELKWGNRVWRREFPRLCWLYSLEWRGAQYRDVRPGCCITASVDSGARAGAVLLLASHQPPDLVCVHSRVDQGGRQHCLRSAAHVIRDPDLATTRGPVNCSVTFVKCVIFQNAIKLCESASASKWRKYWTKSRRFIKQSRRIFSGNCGSFTTPRGEWSVT